MYYDMFPEELTTLMQEIANPEHKPLHELLASIRTADVYEQLAHVAAYCSVILDGLYTPDDLLGLYKLLTKKLYEMRTHILIVH